MSTKILYVEDEPFLGKIVKESLESRGFEVCMVADGREVIAQFKSFQPVVCVLDIMLPYRDGYALAQDIRQLQPDMPIIFLTATTQTEDVLKGFQVDGNDFIRNPFSMEELIVRIQNLLHPVSYTHLDVYKRQTQRHTESLWASNKASAPSVAL